LAGLNECGSSTGKRRLEARPRSGVSVRQGGECCDLTPSRPAPPHPSVCVESGEYERDAPTPCYFFIIFYITHRRFWYIVINKHNTRAHYNTRREWLKDLGQRMGLMSFFVSSAPPPPFDIHPPLRPQLIVPSIKVGTRVGSAQFNLCVPTARTSDKKHLTRRYSAEQTCTSDRRQN
jgi:hypothetical protein